MTVSLIVNGDLSPANSGRRNIDVVVLTSNMTDLAVRILHGGDAGNTPLDGMLTQANDVYLRLHNAADSVPMNLSVPFGVEHSSYWTHMRFPDSTGASAIPELLLAARPGQSTGWVEAGSRLDTLNDGEWSLQAAPDNATLRSQLHYTVHVGVPIATGSIATIATFEEQGCPFFELMGNSPKGPNKANVCPLQLAYDANTRGSRRIRRVEAQVEAVVQRLKIHKPLLPRLGRLPTAPATIISCTDCFPNRTGLRPEWNDSATHFRQAFGLRVQGEDNLSSISFAGCDRAFAYRTVGDPCRNPICWDGIRANASRCLEATLNSSFHDPKVGRCVAVVSTSSQPQAAADCHRSIDQYTYLGIDLF